VRRSDDAGTGGSGLTEAAVRQIATPESFRRGREYLEFGAVERLFRRGDRLEAAVQGSDRTPYQVRVTLGDRAAIEDVSCTCPYSYGGACKHVVATLLAYLRRGESLEERPTLEALLADLDPERLRELVRRLVEQQPHLLELVELEVDLARRPNAPAGAAAPDSTPVDPGLVRRRVAAALGALDWRSGSEAYYAVPSVVGEVRRAAELAEPYLAAGDGRAALAVLEAVVDEYAAGWEVLDDSDGDASALFAELGDRCAEAILSADLSAAERRAWAARLDGWAERVGEYGVEDAFDAAIEAAREGWDDPRVRAALRGEPVARDEDGELPWDERLVAARLEVLARRSGADEYLNLARATGQHVPYATMLVALGRTEEAVAHGLAYLGSPEEALAVARALQERGAVADALELAEHGLDLPGEVAELAGWLRDLASAADRPELALRAGRAAVDARPTLADYGALELLAGEEWPAVRAEVLARLRRSSLFDVASRVDIFLHEGLVDDAIAAVERLSPYVDYALLERVVEAATASHPDWVMRVGREQAAAIAAGGHSQHYDRAARWLGRAGRAAASAGRTAEWRAQVQALLDEHHRKYKLAPLLRALLA
jgi:uncharacterized Zn finger protein